MNAAADAIMMIRVQINSLLTICRSRVNIGAIIKKDSKAGLNREERKLFEIGRGLPAANEIRFTKLMRNANAVVTAGIASILLKLNAMKRKHRVKQ